MNGGAHAGAPGLRRRLRPVGVFLEMVKVSHSIFALPFALAALFLAAGGAPELRVLALVVVACVLARTAAMAFNRWADRHIDARNPRTAARAIPAGQLPPGGVLAVACGCAAAFVGVAALINTLALALSPVALFVLFGYSYTKRFTHGSHLVLGLALGLSPMGAWVAVRGELAVLPALLGLGVLFWTAGFDVIYACQDEAFDRQGGLHSLPSRLGVARALWVSRAFHVAAVALLASVGVLAGGAVAYWIGVGAVAAILAWEQSLVRAGDLSRVNVAFFTLNGVVSLVYMAATVVDVLVRGPAAT